MRLPVLAVVMVCAASLHAQPTPEKVVNMPVINTKEALAAHDGELVTVEGTYRAAPTSKSMKGPPVDLGHGALDVDGRWVRLGEVRRTPEERQEFLGKRVRATGRLVMRPPLKAPPHVAQQVPPPTLFDVKEIVLAE